MYNDLEIGMNFFHFFSMFEYALKANGYRITNEHGIITAPNWDGFVRDNQQLFDLSLNEQDQIKESARYLLDSPPKQQAVNEEDGMEWVEPRMDDNAPDRIKLCKHIRQVRNNLFHGGKFRGNFFETQERSRDLIQHSTIILRHLALSNDGMREAFYGAGYDLERLQPWR